MQYLYLNKFINQETTSKVTLREFIDTNNKKVRILEKLISVLILLDLNIKMIYHLNTKKIKDFQKLD